MKQPQTNSNVQSSIQRLVWVLSFLGLGAGALTLWIQYGAMKKIESEHNRVALAQSNATESLASLSAQRDELFQYLDSYIVKFAGESQNEDLSPKDLYPILSQLGQDFGEFGSLIEEGDLAIQQMRDQIENLDLLYAQLIAYEQDMENVKAGIESSRANIVDEFASAYAVATQVEGKERLKNTLLLRKYKGATEADAPGFAVNYMKSQRSTAEIRVLKSEIAELRVLVEQLVGETNADDLVSLKDNEIAQSVTRIMNASSAVDARYGLEMTSKISLLKEFIFGVGYNDDAEHQTIHTTENGLFELKERYLALEDVGRHMQISTTELMSACATAEQDLGQTLAMASQADSHQASIMLRQAWSRVFLFGMMISAVFIALTWHIAKLGKRSQLQLKESLKEVEAAQREAVAANKSKSQFLANMSHEIRTPMTAILGFADTIRETGNIELAPPERIEAIDTIKRNGEHLLFIINDILDISKIEAGKLEIEKIECSPTQIVTDVQSLMKVRADAKGIAVHVHFESLIPQTILSDPTRLRQILINVVGNAIKFTEVGKVDIRVSLIEGSSGTEPEMRFDIVDTGIGMTLEQSSKLFQAFTQADASTTRKFGGTGLGLNISKRLSGLLGGDISIISEYGEGSTFRITVSTGPLDGVLMLDKPMETLRLNMKDQPAADTKASKLNSNILLAEDGPDNQKLISYVLRKAGGKVTIAENGKIAFDAALKAQAEGNPYDVILMDMQMPVMGGYEATSLLREHGYTGSIIALTAHAMGSDRAKCIDAGCDEFATKPIDKKKLIALIARFTHSQASAA